MEVGPQFLFMKILKIICYIATIFICVLSGIYAYNVIFVESLSKGQFGHQSTKYIDIQGEAIAYGEIDNKAPKTVVFVGGLASWHGTWWETITILNQKRTDYNYIALDLPPFGYSVTKEEISYSRDVQAKRIEAFIEERKKIDGEEQKYIIVAHSYGAGPVMEFVLRDTTNKIDTVVIVDGVLNVDEQKTSTKTLLSRFDALRTFIVGIGAHSDILGISQLKAFTYVHTHLSNELVRLYTQPFSVDGSTTRLSAWAKEYIEDPLEYVSTKSASYKTVKIPVRFIWGDKDTITPLTDTDLLLESVPGSKLHVLKNIGHIPMIEDVEIFVETLESALRE